MFLREMSTWSGKDPVSAECQCETKGSPSAFDRPLFCFVYINIYSYGRLQCCFWRLEPTVLSKGPSPVCRIELVMILPF